VSRYPEITGRKLDVIGVYIAWRGIDLNLPVLKFLTFWSRKSTGYTIASQNACLATISELALAARAPDKAYHHCVLSGHSFGGLVQATRSTWSTITSFYRVKPLLPRVCESLRTARSRPISKKTTQTTVFTRANITMAMKIAFAAMVSITPMKSGHLQDGKFGEGGNLSLPEMIVCPSG
jgi:hypothetical protein